VIKFRSKNSVGFIILGIISIADLGLNLLFALYKRIEIYENKN